MSPSTTVPQDAFKGAPRPGWFTCRVCVPHVRERGGQAEFYRHFNKLHLVTPKESK